MIKLKALLLSIINESTNNQIGQSAENYSGLNWYDKQNKNNIIRTAKIIGFNGNNIFNAKLQDLDLNRTYDIEIDTSTYRDYPSSKGHQYGAYDGTDQIGNTWNIYAIDKNPNVTRLYNAIKLSGRTNSKLGIGIFNSIGAPMYASITNKITKQNITKTTISILDLSSSPSLI